MLDIECRSLLSLDRAIDAVPGRPPHPGRQPVRVELDPHVEVLELPHDRTPELALVRIVRIAWIAECRRVLHSGRLAERQRARQQYLGGENAWPDLPELARQAGAALADFYGECAGVVQERNPVRPAFDCLDDLDRPAAGDPAVGPDRDVVMQGEGLVPPGPYDVPEGLLCLQRHRPAA